MASGRWEPGALLTRTYPLERINDAFQALRDKPAGFIKAVVTM